MNSINLGYKIHTIFMNSENIETLDSHRLLLNLSDCLRISNVLNNKIT